MKEKRPGLIWRGTYVSGYWGVLSYVYRRLGVDLAGHWWNRTMCGAFWLLLKKSGIIGAGEAWLKRWNVGFVNGVCHSWLMLGFHHSSIFQCSISFWLYWSLSAWIWIFYIHITYTQFWLFCLLWEPWVGTAGLLSSHLLCLSPRGARLTQYPPNPFPFGQRKTSSSSSS